jgi:apolipoprotein N-acyltransferase
MQRLVSVLVYPAAATLIAGLIALPWLWQALVLLEWIGLAAGLALLPRLRGWRGEFWTLAAATAAIATAFHWAPKVLAYSMDTSFAVGLLISLPIIIWDACRLALPFWTAARLTSDPRAAWLPAALVACAVEAIMPGVFPWKLGYSQIAWPVLVQAVDLCGPEWSTFVVFAHAGVLVWLGSMLARIWRADGLQQAGAARSAALVPIASVAAIVVCALNLAYGVAAMRFWEDAVAAAPQVQVALVQANPEEAGGLDSLRSLTRQLCADSARVPDVVVWPECSGGSYEQSLSSLADPAEILRKSRDPNRGMRPLDEHACPLLFGGKIFAGYPEKPSELYQSAILLDQDHDIVGCYHKRHLMPFGEYVPGEDWYPELKLYFPMQEQMTAGRDATVLAGPAGTRLGVMLCYEDMLPGAAASLVAGEANVLVSLINGAAFTKPLTLTQHRLLAQLRSVECRRSLVRCAATGETCVISPVGVVAARLPLHEPAVLEAAVPLLEGRTLASRIGPAFPAACGLGLLGMLWRRRRLTTGL